MPRIETRGGEPDFSNPHSVDVESIVFEDSLEYSGPGVNVRSKLSSNHLNVKNKARVSLRNVYKSLAVESGGTSSSLSDTKSVVVKGMGSMAVILGNPGIVHINGEKSSVLIFGVPTGKVAIGRDCAMTLVSPEPLPLDQIENGPRIILFDGARLDVVGPEMQETAFGYPTSEIVDAYTPVSEARLHLLALADGISEHLSEEYLALLSGQFAISSLIDAQKDVA